MTIGLKICGITRPEDIQLCVENNVRWLGLNFAPPSPRALKPALAAELTRLVPTGIKVVGVFVNPSDEILENVLSHVPLEIIQLHGSETPARVAEIKARWQMPIIKAFPIAAPEDLAIVSQYNSLVDYYLFDTKMPPAIHALAGGSGIAFDWSLLNGQNFNKPWFLAGGIKSENATHAAQTGANFLDIASGVESAPGKKDGTKLKAILSALRSA